MYGSKLLFLLMYMSHDIDVRTCCSLGRAPRTKETLPDFRAWCWVTRHPRIFRRLTGCQRTPRVWGVTKVMLTSYGLGSEKSVNLEDVLSIKFPLKYPLSIFAIAHYKSPDGAINDMSGPV